ncbi:MAG: hypothetical protein IBX70_07770 [Clostridia bacterium]|nr:hypothetical protein [Clostridia bacterium]
MIKFPNVNEIKNKASKIAKNTGRSSAIGASEMKTMVVKSAKDSKKTNKKKSKSQNKPVRLYDVKEFLAPDGANPINANHFEIVDNGITYYLRSFYISQLPKRGQFVEVFERLFQFKNCNTTIYIDPISISEAIRKLDDDLTTIEAEILTASEKHDTNRIRKLRNKYSEAEFFQTTLEGRENKKFDVAFIFTLSETSIEALDRRSSEFVFKAKDSGIELVSFYANQEMAYKLNKPFNVKKVANFTSNLISGLKWHPLDLYSLSTIYSHTSVEFYHENGLVIGRNLLTKGHPVSWDLHDSSHSNQNVFFAGTSGYGKSSTIKKLMRLFATIKDQKYVILDVENIKGRGEYADITEALGGYIFEISPKGQNVLNPFEINEEEVYHSESDSYRRTLKLIEKIPYTSNIILSLISSEEQKEQSNIMVRIINEIILELYFSIGLKENEPDTLYKEVNGIVDGKLINQKVRKTLPILTDFLVMAIRRKLENKEAFYHTEYLNLIAGLTNYVKELHICEYGCGKTFSTDETKEKNHTCECGSKISSIYGAFHFFDGQSTSDAELNFDNYPVISIDISNVPNNYMPKAMLIGLNFILETIVKKNSENPAKAKRITVVNDEQHKTFKTKVNRSLIIEGVRVIRKKSAGIWSITQSIFDYTLYEESKAIITQSDSAFIFRHKNADRDALKVLLDNANESDLDFITNCKIGNLYLQDAAGKARVKVDLLPIELSFANTDLQLEKERLNA